MPPKNHKRSKIWNAMDTLKAMYIDIAQRKFPSLWVSGPPGLGKTHFARRLIDAHGAQAVFVKATAATLLENIEPTAGVRFVNIFDDPDRIYTPANMMEFKALLDPNPEVRRMLQNGRKAGSQPFPYDAGTVVITNVDPKKPKLSMPKTLIPHFEAVMSRIPLQLHIPTDVEATYSYTCEAFTEESRALIDRMGLSISAINEGFEWFSRNGRSFGATPRGLLLVLQTRKANPQRWVEYLTHKNGGVNRQEKDLPLWEFEPLRAFQARKAAEMAAEAASIALDQRPQSATLISSVLAPQTDLAPAAVPIRERSAEEEAKFAAMLEKAKAMQPELLRRAARKHAEDIKKFS